MRMPRLRSSSSALVRCLVLLSLGAADRLSAQDTGSPPSTDSDLAGYCEATRAGGHPQLGRQPLEELEQRYAEMLARASDDASPPDVLARAQTALRLAEERASHWQLDGTFELYEEARSLVAGMDDVPPRLAQIDFLEALVHLRVGEEASCTLGDDAEACLLLEGSEGVHRDQAHTLRAIDLLESHLRSRPDDLTSRWLLNLAYDRLGRYPDYVPEDLRLDLMAFGTDVPAPRFRDVARPLGVAASSLLGGAILDDFDGDGLLDIFTTSYEPCTSAILYRNEGDGRFTDVSSAAGLGGQLGGFNAQQTDYDNDGDLDVFITRGGWQQDFGRHRNSLLRNDGGRFTDVTREAGLAEPAYPTQASAWADYDGDGDLDLYVANEMGNTGDPYPAQLFRNDGDGHFTDVAAAAGVTNARWAKGVTWGDYDNDGDPDLYVANLGPNRLYRNEGDGRFVDIAPELGVTEPVIRSFATWFWDYDNDGWLDLYVASYGGTPEDAMADMSAWPDAPPPETRSRLYRNDGRGGFQDVSSEAGVFHARMPMGVNFGDIDNDGWLDFYLGTGNPPFSALLPNVMYWNERGERFHDVTLAAGVGHLAKGHGIAFGDVDGDGDQDLYLQTGGFQPADVSRNAFFENPGTGNHWVTIRLIGRSANRAALMGRVRVDIVEGGARRSVYGLVSSGGSFGANSLQQELGLGRADRIEGLAVLWPGDTTWQEYPPAELDIFVEIEQGEAAPRVIEREAFELRR